MATTNVRVPERRNTTYKQGDRLQFQIDGSSVPMLDAGNCFLRFNVNVGGKGVQTTPAYAVGDMAAISHLYPYMFNEKIGCESIIKELTIKTLDEVVLEQVTSYNVLCRAMANTEQNQTMNNLKRLYGGADIHNITEENTLTRRIQDNDANTQENREIECLVNFNCSGLLSGKNKEPLPVSALGGLIVEILLEEDVWKCVQFQGERVMDANGENFRGNKDLQSNVLGYSQDAPYYVEAITPAYNSNAVTSITLFEGNHAGANVKTGVATQDRQACYTPIYNGQKIVIGTTNPVEVDVAKVSISGGKVEITIESTDFSTNAIGNPYVYVKYQSSYGKPDINFSNVELICGVVQPNEKQLKAMASQVGSKQGMMYNYESFGSFSVNLGRNALRTSSYIPSNYTRATSLFSCYENIEEATDPRKDNLCPPVDSNTKPLDYQMVINNLLVPTRAVKLNKYNNNRTASGGWNSIHIKQLVDSMHCASKSVRDLSDLDGCLVIGQCLAPKPHTFNMSASTGETRLNLNFEAQSRALLLHNFVHHYKTLVVKQNSKMVIE